MTVDFRGLRKALENANQQNVEHIFSDFLFDDSVFIRGITYKDNGVEVVVDEYVEELPSEDELEYETVYEYEDHYKIRYKVLVPYEFVVKALIDAIKYGVFFERNTAIVVLKNWLGEKADNLVKRIKEKRGWKFLYEIFRKVYLS